MISTEPNPSFLYRDGTSQAARVLAALDPATVAIDGRTFIDWLKFLRSYAQHLTYFNLANEPDGDWTPLLAFTDQQLLEIAAFVQNPENYAAPQYDAYRRPHFALLLAFLQMLESVQAQVNQITQRHLDFYYREVLGFALEPGAGGSVHVLVEPMAGQTPFLLPAGTLLEAGQDDQGAKVNFQTDQDLVVTNAQISRMMGLHLEQKVIGLDDIRQDSNLLLDVVAQKPAWWNTKLLTERAFLALLQVAVGNPNPGDPLPPYVRQGGQSLPINEALLGDLDQLCAFIPQTLGLTLPTFLELIDLRHQLDITRPEVSAQWTAVNQTLQQAAAKKGNTFNVPPAHLDDFEGNLDSALKIDPATAYNALEGVDDVYELARRVDPSQANSPFNNFVTDQQNGLAMSVADFQAMMAIVNQFYDGWRRVLDILRQTASRNPTKVAPITAPNLRTYDGDRWNTLLWMYLGPISAAAYPTLNGNPLVPTISGESDQDHLGRIFDQLYQESVNLQNALYLTAADFIQARQVNQNTAAKPWEWAAVYALLNNARRQQGLAQRLAALQALREKAGNTLSGVQAMVTATLGDPKTGLLPDARTFFNPNLDPQKDADYIQDRLHLTPEEVGTIEQIATKPTPTPNDWNLVAQILDQSARRRDNWSPPKLEFISFQNLYAAPDVTKLLSGSASGNDPMAKHWRTFGDGPRNDGATTPGTLGFMVASPLLALAEGTRTITLTFGFTDASYTAGADDAIKSLPNDLTSPFRFFLSTAKGLVEIEPPNAFANPPSGSLPAGLPVYPHMLRFRLQLDAQAPAIAALPSSSSAPGNGPVLQVVLRDLGPSSALTKQYEVFRPLIIERVHLHVEAGGITGLLLQNDESTLNPKQPFEPFGRAPVAGSRFLFTHAEVSTKKLDELDATFDWLGLPLAPPNDNFGDWYKDYPAPNPIVNNASFTAEVILYDRGAFFSISDLPIFGADANGTGVNAQDPLIPTTSMGITASAITTSYPRYAPSPDAHLGDSPLDCDRYWILELGSPDFQHSRYPVAVIEAAKATPSVVLNPPYTPRVKALRLHYRASVELDPAANGPEATDQLYYVEPFGYRLIRTAPMPVAGQDLPPVAYWLPPCDLEGQLFIGLTGVAAPENLSLLFQVAAGSADPDVVPDTVRWHYLNDNQWFDLDDDHLLSDSTRSLLNAGIIEFAIPAVTPSTLLPADCYWIRASIARNSLGVSDLVDVRTQAVSASLASVEAGFSLPPNRITDLVQSRPEVKAIQQPYSSFGDRPAEMESAFTQRISERLRHKDRALTCWDYERLVLEAFPNIYKVKCLPVGSMDDPALAPVVQVIVIPDIRGKSPFDPFEPKASAETLTDIQNFLTARSPVTATVQVRNPSFLRLRLRFGVRLKASGNPAFYQSLLNEEVCRFLAPWAYDQAGDIVFGNRISANLIVYFIEQRPYIDYVAGMTIFLQPDGGAPEAAPSDELDLSLWPGAAPDVIIVSAPQHDIDLIHEEAYVPESFVGIGFMKIELDFRVA